MNLDQALDSVSVILSNSIRVQRQPEKVKSQALSNRALISLENHQDRPQVFAQSVESERGDRIDETARYEAYSDPQGSRRTRAKLIPSEPGPVRFGSGRSDVIFRVGGDCTSLDLSLR